MNVSQLREIIRHLPAAAEVSLLLPGTDGLPDYASASEVRSVQVDYTGDGEVEGVSIVYT